MIVTLEIADDVAGQLTADGGNLARTALDALAVDAYRTGRLGEEDVRRMLGYETRMQVHELLKEHGVYLQYGVEEFEQDLRTLGSLHDNKTAA